MAKSSKPRVTLIHNRNAGGRGHDRKTLTALIKGAGYEVAYHDAKTGDIDAALKKPADLIAIAGGDGTVRRVATRATAKGPPIAILPLGTANNIAKSLRIDAATPTLVAGWAHARPYPYHLIDAELPWGRQRLIEGVGFGALAAVIDRVGGRKVSPAEAREHMSDLVLRHDAEHLELSFDDTSFTGDFALLEVVSIPLVGPNLRLAPEADPGEQLLDIGFCGASPGEREQLSAWIAGAEPGAPAPLSIRRASRVAIAGHFARVRVDDDIRELDTKSLQTIVLATEPEPLRFLVSG